MPTKAEAAQEILRRDNAQESLACFAMERGFWPARHHQIIIEKLEAVARGECKRLIVIAWPGAAKSTYVSQLFPAWLMTRKSWHGMPWDILATSHNSDLALDFSYRVRSHLKDSEDLLEVGLETDALDEWRTTKGDAYRAFGIMAGITGRRFDIGIGDDWVKSRAQADSPGEMDKLWRAYLSDFRSRKKPDSAIVIVMTHWSDLDPIGRILPETWDGESGKIQARDGEVWDVVCFAALSDGRPDDPLGRSGLDESGWPEWQPAEGLKQERKTLTEGGEARTWSACYQGRPTPDSGDFFERAMFRYFDQLPPGCRYFVSSDFAVSEKERADKIAHGLWAVDGERRLYLIDVWCERPTLTNDGTDAALDMVATAMGRGELGCWLNESGVIRQALGGTIRAKMDERNIHCSMVDYHRGVDKRAFAAGIKNRYAGGKVYHARGAPWVAEYEHELIKFTGAKNGKDDRVDMAALVGQHMDQVIAPPRVSMAPVIAPSWDLFPR